MNFVYFKSDKTTAQNYYNTWAEIRKELWACKDLIKDTYNADGLSMHGRYIIGFLLKGPDHEERRGFKMDNKTTESGTQFSVFQPDCKFKEGKEFKKLADRHYHLGSKTPGFSAFVISKLGVSRFIAGIHDRVLYRSTAGITKGFLLVKIPYDDDNPAPAKLPDHEKIKKSEFIAITEE